MKNLLISLITFALFMGSIKVSILVEDYLKAKYGLLFWADFAGMIIIAPFLLLFFNHFFFRNRKMD